MTSLGELNFSTRGKQPKFYFHQEKTKTNSPVIKDPVTQQDLQALVLSGKLEKYVL